MPDDRTPADSPAGPTAGPPVRPAAGAPAETTGTDASAVAEPRLAVDHDETGVAAGVADALSDSSAPLSTSTVDSAPPPREYGLPRGVIILLGLAATVIAAAGLQTMASIIAPTFLALTLVITAHPIMSLLIRRRCPRWLAAVVTLVVVYVVVLGLVASLALSVAQLIIVMPQYTGRFVALYRSTIDWLTSLGLSSQQITTALSSFDPTTLIPAATSLLGSTLGATSVFVFLLTVTVFVVMDAGDIPRRLKLAARERPQLVAALDAFAVGVRRYWLVSAIFGLIVAVLDVGALFIIGVPLAVMWGLLSFITNFIPNIGFVLGVIPPALLALLDGGVGKMIAVLVVYSVLNLVIQVIIQPKFTGDAVGVTTTVSFLSLAFWAFILGPLGALLALPATLFAKTMLVDADPRSRWLNALLAANPK